MIYEIPAAFKDDELYVPFRACAEAMGYRVRYVESLDLSGEAHTRIALLSDALPELHFNVDENSVQIGVQQVYYQQASMRREGDHFFIAEGFMKQIFSCEVKCYGDTYDIIMS